MAQFKRILPRKLNGKEHLINSGGKNVTVLDFWQYAFSTINANVLRGAFAEFLVECSINNISEIGVREAWGDYDVLSKSGTKIEVKCSSYIQDWDQSDYSEIVWAGLKAKELYYSEAVKSMEEMADSDYKAEVYVLALLMHKDPKTLNILDMDQWVFYVLSRDQLRLVSNDSSRVTLAHLMKHGSKEVGFSDLAGTIEQSHETQ